MIKFKILTKTWRIRLLPKKKFIKKYTKQDVAVTVSHKRRIDVREKHNSRETITHELVHAYLDEICTRSATLNRDDFEEIVAEFISRHGKELFSLSKQLTKKLSK